MARYQVTIAAELAAVGVISAIALGFGINHQGIASGYVDPLLHAGAQDEAVYGYAAARMVRTGHWLTPVFLDRFMLNKPPLLIWAGAISMRLSHISPLTLRLPVIAAGVLCCILVYWWLRRSQPMATAISGVVLLLSAPLFHAMTRRFMTDALLTLFVVAAMFLVGADPRWERRATPFAFGALSGAAIMTKSAAGLLPLLIVIAYWAVCWIPPGAKERPPLRRIFVAVGVAALLAAPWHVYEFVVHKDWFIAEYVRFQLLGSGVTAPSRYNEDTNFWFYLRTLLDTDPVLIVLWLTALPWIVIAWRRSNASESRLLTSWFITVALCLGVFGTRAAYYLLPLLPALALMSVQFSPLLRGRLARPACALLMVLFGIKAWNGDTVWGLDYGSRSVPPALALDDYARLRRANELLIVSADDEFYASVLNLSKIRYVYLTPLDATKTSGFFYRRGMILSAEEFCSLERLLPVYEQRLRAWKLPQGLEPEGTLIDSGTVSKLDKLIRCSPERDFLIPEELRYLAVRSAAATHVLTETQSGHFFLLSRNTYRLAQDFTAPGWLEPNSHY